MINVEARVDNKILDMYSKCCLMVDAPWLFEPHPNETSQDDMIICLANNGLKRIQWIFSPSLSRRG